MAEHLKRPASSFALWDDKAWLDSSRLNPEPVPPSEGSLAPEPAPPKEVNALRQRGMTAIAVSVWVITAFIVIMALNTKLAGLWAAAMAAVFAVVMTLVARSGNIGQSGRWCAAATAALVPTTVILAFLWTGMQANYLIPYMVSLITFNTLCDKRACGWVGLASLIQFLIFRIGAKLDSEPSLQLFWGIFAETIGLILIIMVMVNFAGTVFDLFAKLHKAQQDGAMQTKLLQRQSDQLEQALRRVETERQERERFEAEQAEARKADIRRIAQDFEDSISVVTGSISETALKLDRATKALGKIAQDTGEGADTVSESAQAASKASQTVAQGVAELSSSIANIAINVGQQDDLTSAATQRSISGGEAVGGLAQHSDTIGEATRAIVRIAERTNLLSLNAAIEAASAGAAGRGFTIVAQEVKALALQASEAATEIDNFLKGVRAGTHEAEHSFKAIDSAITELAQAATAIRWDVESQRKSADTIEDYARAASVDIGAMAERSKALADTAHSTQELSAQLDSAAAAMLRNVRDLEQSTAQFVANLKAD